MLKKLAFGLMLGPAMTGAFAQAVTAIQARPNHSAYLQDNRGAIVRSADGLCWRTAYWTPADAVAGCDGELAPPIAKPTAPAIATPAAAVAQAPAPLPPAAPRPCDFAVTLGNDQAFAFNQSVLSNAAKKRIDEEVLPRLAACAKVDVVLVTGHTDRLGSSQYNRKLSEKRARTVAAYLKSKGASARIDAVGAGAAQPVSSCNAKLARARLIDCLATDRRVAIEVKGVAK